MDFSLFVETIRLFRKAEPVTRGIDIARYQDYPDWNAVRGSDVHYAYIKATEGTTYVSTHVDGQWAEASDVGMPRGLYHYARIGNPEAEAELFVKLINAKGAKGSGFLPPCLDIEVGEGHLGWWVVRFVARLRGAVGVRRVMLYSGGSFYRDQIGDAALDPDVLVWIAHYDDSPGNSPYLTPKTVLHQYTSTGRVAGIAGKVDLDWALRPLPEIIDGAPGGSENMAFNDSFKDWAGNEQTVYFERTVLRWRPCPACWPNATSLTPTRSRRRRVRRWSKKWAMFPVRRFRRRLPRTTAPDVEPVRHGPVFGMAQIFSIAPGPVRTAVSRTMTENLNLRGNSQPLIPSSE